MIVKAFCVLKPGHAGDDAHGEGAAGPREGHASRPSSIRARSSSWQPAAHGDRQAAAFQTAAIQIMMQTPATARLGSAERLCQRRRRARHAGVRRRPGRLECAAAVRVATISSRRRGRRLPTSRRPARSGRRPRAHRAHDLVRHRQRRVRPAPARLGPAYRESIGRHFPAMTACTSQRSSSRAPRSRSRSPRWCPTDPPATAPAVSQHFLLGRRLCAGIREDERCAVGGAACNLGFGSQVFP